MKFMNTNINLGVYMKTIIVNFMILVSTVAYGIDGTLDGKTFCRKVISDGMFGQPSGISLHCLSFKGGRVTDNSNTCFSRPPESFTYDVDGIKIINVDTNKISGYECNA